MNILDQILENYSEDEFAIIDGFESAVIGHEYSSLRLIYSVTQCIRLLQESYDITEFEALDYFLYNTVYCFNGEIAPIWCWDNFD